MPPWAAHSHLASGPRKCNPSLAKCQALDFKRLDRNVKNEKHGDQLSVLLSGLLTSELTGCSRPVSLALEGAGTSRRPAGSAGEEAASGWHFESPPAAVSGDTDSASMVARTPASTGSSDSVRPRPLPWCPGPSPFFPQNGRQRARSSSTQRVREERGENKQLYTYTRTHVPGMYLGPTHARKQRVHLLQRQAGHWS